MTIDSTGTLALLHSLQPYISGDDAGLPRREFLRLVSDRIFEDIDAPARNRSQVFVLVWHDKIDLTVEVHATVESAVDSASKLVEGKREPFKDHADLDHYMAWHPELSGGVFPRTIAEGK